MADFHYIYWMKIVALLLFFALCFWIGAMAFDNAFPMDDVDEENDESRPFW